MARFGRALPPLVEGISAEAARWKPADGAWSILEIVRHLADEELEDFGARLRAVLRDPAEDWTPIDPPGWAVERRYNEGDLSGAAATFVARRLETIAWLRGLSAFDPALKKEHPKLGPLHAGDLLAAWTAHDALHLRQIAKRMHQLAGEAGAPYSTGYAGEWGP